MSTVQRERTSPLLPSQFSDLQLGLLTAELIARPKFASCCATMLTSTPHWTPLPTAPSPITRRRPVYTPPKVLSPSSLIFVVGREGGCGEQVGAARDAAAANSPSKATRPVTPAAQIASTLIVSAQLDAANDSFAARVPTKAIMMPLSTSQASSEAVSRGAGQVRAMPLTASPKAMAEVIASMTLKMHTAVPCARPFFSGWTNEFGSTRAGAPFHFESASLPAAVEAFSTSFCAKVLDVTALSFLARAFIWPSPSSSSFSSAQPAPSSLEQARVLLNHVSPMTKAAIAQDSATAPARLKRSGRRVGGASPGSESLAGSTVGTACACRC
mmetsp:Transcript_27766/g.79748  ORF Transcript_27766/g.79748 Transcript_27766/m.79748 type:complete len:328 (-) Transcript_27766:115-1098(-)